MFLGRFTHVCYIWALRFGPRQIRVESALLRAYNSGTRAAPYQSITVADIGDVNVNLYDLQDTCRRIRDAYRKIVSTGCVPLTLGESWWSPPVLQQCFNSTMKQTQMYKTTDSCSCIHLFAGGDHTISYPILQAMAER